MKPALGLCTSLASFVLLGCAPGDGEQFTLYRNSAIDPGMRVHVATFNAADGESYNRENCELAGSLFQAQPGVAVKFWCEKGQYRK